MRITRYVTVMAADLTCIFSFRLKTLESFLLSPNIK